MENWVEEIQKYLPDAEEFLTSVLLEETNITVAESDTLDRESVTSDREKTDIFLVGRDTIHESDVIIVLDEVWYGLLSSIMLGVEEKSNNEITRDLLKKFSADFSGTMLPKMKDGGLQIDLADAGTEVLTAFQVAKQLQHEKYYWARLEVEGLADDKVRAEILLGNPEAPLQPDLPDEGERIVAGEAQSVNEEKSGDFAEVDADEMEQMGQQEEVISGRYIEFEDFDEQPEDITNGQHHSMDLLKDVEMDVSVELGRIELPLGKVLQLAKGSVIELEKLAGEPVDILVNGRCIAHGEVVVIDEHFGVRVSNLITTKQRLAGLNS